MPSLKMSCDVLGFDAKRFNKATQEAMAEILRSAIASFVLEASKLVPVDTGMARGAYQELGYYVGVYVPISPISFDKKYYHKKGASPEPKNAITAQDYVTWNKIVYKRGSFTFRFAVDIAHFKLLDPEKWQSMISGQAALITAIRLQQKSKLPKLLDFVTKTRIGNTSRQATVRSSK